MLLQSNADLEQFGYALGHDLKEPLRAVYGFAGRLIQRHSDSDDPATRECVQFIREGIDRARAMIDGLLSCYSATRASDAPAAALESTALLDEVLKNCSASIEECGAKVTHDPLPPVSIDRAWFIQILQNLVSNALKYRRVDVPPRIHVSARVLNGQVEFAVRDNGIGIEAEHRERIFQLFQRLHGDKYSGIGLGLSLCARLVQRSGGEIWVDAAPEAGSIFYFTLPAPESTCSGEVVEGPVRTASKAASS
jgi:signal transduction histidine kinase